MTKHPNVDYDTGRQAGTEIEITPEMIRRAMDCLEEYWDASPSVLHGAVVSVIIGALEEKGLSPYIASNRREGAENCDHD